jgi:predicted RNA binding protein YcfA (HicA-like mRNA interferase family)
MPKAARILAALHRDGWVEVRRRGSHRLLAKGNRRVVWAWHDGSDLGGPAMNIVAKEFGYSVDDLRRL